MAKSGIFSVDIDEALGLTTLDYETVDLDVDRTSPGTVSSGQQTSSWPHHSNQGNGLAVLPNDASRNAEIIHHQSHRSDSTSTPTLGQKQRFVRPESVGKDSPGFVYTRPDIKHLDQRRNLGGKIQSEPPAQKGHIAVADLDLPLRTHHDGKLRLTAELPNEAMPRELYEGRSDLQLAQLPPLQAISTKSTAKVEPQPEGLNERDNLKASENANRKSSPDKPGYPSSETGRKLSSERSDTLHVPSMADQLLDLTRSTVPVPLHEKERIPTAHSLETHNTHGPNKSPSHQSPTHSVVRGRPNRPTASVLRPHATGKIEKRRTGRQACEHRVQPMIEHNHNVPDQVEILQILAFRAKQERDAQQAIARDLVEHKKQLERTKSEYSKIEIQLGQGLEREHAQSTELQRFKNLLSSLKGKAKKLDDYVKGLSNDHNKLRDDAISLRQQSESLQDDRRVIQNALADTRSTLQTITMIDKGALTEARLQLGNLQKVVNQQHLQLMDKSDLLDTERKRLRTLEGELARIATSQERMTESVRSDQKELLKGLKVLLNDNGNNAEGSKTVIPSGALKRCVELLEQIHSRKGVKPRELDKLGECIRTQLESITTTVEQANKELGSHHKLEANLLARFDSLIAGLKSQEDLVEKSALLREAESILHERTQANENLLALSRQQIKDLQSRESTHLQSIASFQAKLNHPIAPSENPRLLQRIDQLENQNRELQQECASLQAFIDNLKEQADAQHAKSIEVAENIRLGEVAMDEVKTLTAKIEKVKVDYERQAATELENLRQELSKASTEEKRLMARAHSNALHQLQHQLSVSRDNSVKMEGKLKEATRIREEQTQALNSLRIQTGQHAYEMNENEKSINHLEEQLQEATQNGLSKDAEIQKLQEANAALGKKNNDAQLQKDEAVHRLASHLAATASEHTKILQHVNALCTKGDKTLKTITSIEDALEILERQIDSLRDDSQATLAAAQTQSQELLFSSEPDSIDGNGRPDNLEDVALIVQAKNSQDKAGQTVNKKTPHVPRPRAVSQVRSTPFRDMLQESHIEETTTVRRVKRTTASHGLVDTQVQAGSPLKRREAIPVMPSFAEFNKGMKRGAHGSPAPENIKEFFPPTPLQPAWPQLDTQPSQSMAKAPIAFDATRERRIPSILGRPTSSVIRGDLGTSPTPIQSTRTGTKTRVEASSSKMHKVLETTETVKESNVPKGILKPSRVPKRSATDASLETASQPTRKRASALGSGLGPIISSHGREGQGGAMPKVEGRRRGTKRRGSGRDKYQERFAGGI